MASQTSALSKKPKTNETNFEKNITEVTGKTNKNDAINSIISIREVELHGVPMQCVCGTWCTSKIYFYQVLSKPNSAIKIGNACRNKYLKKKKRKVCKNINKKTESYKSKDELLIDKTIESMIDRKPLIDTSCLLPFSEGSL